MQDYDDTRLRPIHALRCLFEVVRDPEKTGVGADMVKSLEGRSREHLIERFLADPTGARILAEGRRLDHTLMDRALLESMPLGSLGQSYAAWSQAEGISAEGLIETTGYVPRKVEDERQLIGMRGASTHDLWHVVTGYGRDHLGEIALLHFTLLQTGNTGLILPCWLGVLTPRIGRAGRRLIFEARHRARRATWLPVADWEALLPQPLPTVRERLRVGLQPRYTPVWGDSRPAAA